MTVLDKDANLMKPSLDDAEVHALASYCCYLGQSLNKHESCIQTDDIQLYLSSLPTITTHILCDTSRQLLWTSAATLWNICNTLDASWQQQEVVACCRAFAVLTLSCVRDEYVDCAVSINDSCQNLLVTARLCLDTRQLDVAYKVLEAAAQLLAPIYGKLETSTITERELDCVAICDAMFMFHSWLRDRKDLTEHWFQKLIKYRLAWRVQNAELAVDLLIQFGEDCLSSGFVDSALLWLERARSCVENESLSAHFTASDLKLSILCYQVRALQIRGAKSDLEDLQVLFSLLEQEYGSKLSTELLVLDLLFLAPHHHVGLIVDKIRSLVISPGNQQDGNIIFQLIVPLHEYNSAQARMLMIEYIKIQLENITNTRQLDKSVVVMISMYTKANFDAIQDLHQLDEILEETNNRRCSPISEAAAQAVHLIVRKAIESSESSNRSALAIKWCSVALHPLFSAAGETSTTILQQRLLTLHMKVSNMVLARGVFEGMSFISKNHKGNLFLAYRLALRLRDNAETQSVLNTIANTAGMDEAIVFACAGEALDQQDRLEAVRVLQRLFDKHHQGFAPKVQIEALLRYTARLLYQVVEATSPTGHVSEEVSIRLCTLLRNVIKCIRGEYKTTSSPAPSGWRWLAHATYAVIMQHFQQWRVQYLIDLLEYHARIASLTGLEPNDCVRAGTTLIQHHLYIGLARSCPMLGCEDLPRTAYDVREKPYTDQVRLCLYRNTFQKFMIAKEEMSKRTVNVNSSDSSTLNSSLRISSATASALEALLYLSTHRVSQVDDFHINDASIAALTEHLLLSSPHVEDCAAMVNTVLRFTGTIQSQEHHDGQFVSSQLAAKLLSSIAGGIRHDEDTYNVQKASRWIHCIVELIVKHVEDRLEDVSTPEDSVIMLKTVCQQAISMMRFHETAIDMYPEDEKQWLACRVYNLAVDLYMVKQNGLARVLVHEAITIAECMTAGKVDDEHALVSSLRSKAQEMNLVEESE